MLDKELLSAFDLFLESLPRMEELSPLVGWRMVYSIMQVLVTEGSTIGEVSLKASMFCTPQVFFRLSRLYMMDTVTWTTVEVGKREAQERLAAMPYETVTSYSFSKWWQDC